MMNDEKVLDAALKIIKNIQLSNSLTTKVKTGSSSLFDIFYHKSTSIKYKY